METIRKKINLEPTRNRYINKKVDGDDESKTEYLNKSYYYSNNELYKDGFSWGGNCVDLLIPYMSTKTKTQGKLINKNIYNWCTHLYLLNSGVCKSRIPMTFCRCGSDGEIYEDIFNNESGKTYINVDGGVLEYNESVYGKRYLFIRYKNLLSYYHWVVREFIPSCTFYKVCKRGYTKIEKKFNDRIENVNKYFDNPIIDDTDDINLVKILPSLSHTKINDIYCVTQLLDELIDRFGDLYVVGAFIRFCNYYFNNGISSIKNHDNLKNMLYKTPYITVPLVLTQDCINVGEYSDTIEEWVPKKKYYLGDIVYYNGETYILNCGDAYDETIVPKIKFEFSGLF